MNENNREEMTLLEEMRMHTKKLRDMRKNEDPRLSFCTPEFREAQRVFQENYKKVCLPSSPFLAIWNLKRTAAHETLSPPTAELWQAGGAGAGEEVPVERGAAPATGRAG